MGKVIKTQKIVKEQEIVLDGSLKGAALSKCITRSVPAKNLLNNCKKNGYKIELLLNGREEKKVERRCITLLNHVGKQILDESFTYLAFLSVEEEIFFFEKKRVSLLLELKKIRLYPLTLQKKTKANMIAKREKTLFLDDAQIKEKNLLLEKNLFFELVKKNFDKNSYLKRKHKVFVVSFCSVYAESTIFPLKQEFSLLLQKDNENFFDDTIFVDSVKNKLFYPALLLELENLFEAVKKEGKTTSRGLFLAKVKKQRLVKFVSQLEELKAKWTQ